MKSLDEYFRSHLTASVKDLIHALRDHESDDRLLIVRKIVKGLVLNGGFVRECEQRVCGRQGVLKLFGTARSSKVTIDLQQVKSFLAVGGDAGVVHDTVVTKRVRKEKRVVQIRYCKNSKCPCFFFFAFLSRRYSDRLIAIIVVALFTFGKCWGSLWSYIVEMCAGRVEWFSCTNTNELWFIFIEYIDKLLSVRRH
jgi:hypothetical protein